MKVHGKPRRSRVRDEREPGKARRDLEKWFRIRDTYGVEIRADQDVPLILAITVAVEELTSVGH